MEGSVILSGSCTDRLVGSDEVVWVVLGGCCCLAFDGQDASVLLLVAALEQAPSNVK